MKSNNSALYTLISVFFFWGFFGASNGVFIPFCKSKFNLDQFQSQLIDFAFYGAYYIGALLLFIFSSLAKKDILNGWGFKKGIINGLFLSTFGAGFMIYAVNQGSYSLILAALFVVALGFSLQQTSAQPFVVSLGDVNTASNRLNLAGGINSFGTTLGPIVVSAALFGTAAIGKVNEDFIKNWLDKSFVNRHDYMALEKNIQSAELDCFVSKKSVKPRLDLTLTTGYTGLSQALNSEQYYQSLTQNIPGVNYMVGLSFVFLGKNDYAKGKEIETLSTLDILEEQKKKLILNIHNQIKQTGNNYKNNAQVVGFLSESEKNYKKAYQNEIRKFQAGTSTSFIVVQVQNDYLLSKNQLVSLLTDLNISVLEFRHNTGTLIEAQSDNTFNIDPTKIFTLPLAK